MAIMQIRSGKSEGPGNIPCEALRSDTQVTAKMLHVLQPVMYAIYVNRYTYYVIPNGSGRLLTEYQGDSIEVNRNAERKQL